MPTQAWRRYCQNFLPLPVTYFSVAGFFQERSQVDFIERHLGFSPDDGDGQFEVMFLMALLTIIAGIAMGFFHKRDVRS
jgi:hypothetical protein